MWIHVRSALKNRSTFSFFNQVWTPLVTNWVANHSAASLKALMIHPSAFPTPTTEKIKSHHIVSENNKAKWNKATWRLDRIAKEVDDIGVLLWYADFHQPKCLHWSPWQPVPKQHGFVWISCSYPTHTLFRWIQEAMIADKAPAQLLLHHELLPILIQDLPALRTHYAWLGHCF